MKIITLLFSLMLLAACSASVRPLYSDTSDVSAEKLSKTVALGLDLSEPSERRLAKGLAQSEKFCAEQQKSLDVTVGQEMRRNELIPVIYIQCEHNNGREDSE